MEGEMKSPEQKEALTHVLKDRAGNSVTLSEWKPGIYEIVDDSVTQRDGDPNSDLTELVYAEWDETVENLDNHKTMSDASYAGEGSQHLRWQDIEITNTEIKAPSVDKIKEALQHVEIGGFCPGDM